MQRFVAELSRSIEKVDFERSWPVNGSRPKVDFVFDGRRITAAVHSDASNQWPSASFHETFSTTIRRLDRTCNVRWI
jgi:hypothetical protein